MKRKGLVITGMVLSMALASAFTSFAGEWKFDGPENWKWKYVNDDGSNSASKWQQVDGKWYHFDEEGYLDVSQWITEEETKTQYIEGVGVNAQ